MLKTPRKVITKMPVLQPSAEFAVFGAETSYNSAILLKLHLREKVKKSVLPAETVLVVFGVVAGRTCFSRICMKESSMSFCSGMCNVRLTAAISIFAHRTFSHVGLIDSEATKMSF